jgi:ubiquinone/menaquinone biosynthesis C-methylase UbiE
MINKPHEVWTSGDTYEPYVGRWSRLVAKQFLEWLNLPSNSSWLDVGCGTGALSQTILNVTAPQKVIGIDRSDGYVEFARRRITDPRASFEVGDAQDLKQLEDKTIGAVVSSLVLNFVPQPDRMVAEMKRVVKTGGVVALYVWDYAGKMQMMQHFWNAAAAVDPAAIDRHGGRRFPICDPDQLSDLFQSAGLKNVEARPIDIDTHFKDFDDYWTPFLGGQGPAPGYYMSLSEDRRAALREKIRSSLPFALDGSIPLVARAWAVRGTC